MTTSRAALTTIVAHLSDGTRALIVGRIDAFPGHPAAGTPVEPLAVGTGEAATDHDGPLFALVSVTWATEVTTHSLTTGDTVTGLPVAPPATGATTTSGAAATGRPTTVTIDVAGTLVLPWSSVTVKVTVTMPVVLDVSVIDCNSC